LLSPGQSAKMKVWRDQSEKTVEIKVSEAPGRALARLALVGRLADLDLDGRLALVPPDLHLRGLAGREQADRALQVHRPCEPLAVELDEHVAALDSGDRKS